MTPMTKDINAAIIGLHSEGHSPTEIAKEVGRTYDSVRGVLYRNKLSVPKKMPKDWWDLAQEMTPLDAVEYLRGIIEMHIPMLTRESHEVEKWGIKLTNNERRLLRTLYDLSTGVVSKGHLLTAISAHKSADEVPYIKIIDAYICRLRKKLPASIGTIKTVWGEGYVFVRNAEVTE